EWPDAFFNKGNALAGLERFEEAISCYKEVLCLEPPTEVVYYYIAECFENMLDYEKAIEYYKKCLQLEPEYADALSGIAVSLDSMGLSAQALPYSMKAVDIEPENPNHWYIAAHINGRQGFSEAAQMAFEKVVEFDDTRDKMLEVISSMFDFELYKGAADILLRAVNEDVASPDIYFALCASQIKLKEMPEALRYLQKGLEINADKYEVLFGLAPESALINDLTSLIETYKTQ
ncbi:MAG: tetratricopeptide repeat protein, partial [Flavobacteriales bacterium]